MTETILLRLAAASLELPALALIAWGVPRVLGVRSPRVQSFLWLAVLVKPMLTLAGLAALPLPLLPAADAPVHAGVPSPLEVVIEEERILMPTTGEIERVVELTNDEVELALEPDEDERRRLLPGTAPPSSRSGFTSYFGALLLGAWILGVVGFTIRIARAHGIVARIRRRSSAPGVELAKRFRGITRRGDSRHAPRLLVTDDLDSPAIAGALRPVILVPRWLATSHGSSLDWALRHEWMHHRAGDPIASLVRQLSQALLFFHPLVWWCGRRWEECIEMACDDAAVGHREPADYARTLFALAERMHRMPAPTASLHAMRTRTGRRIERLLTDADRRRPTHALRIAAALAVMALAMGLGVTSPVRAKIDPAGPLVRSAIFEHEDRAGRFRLEAKGPFAVVKDPTTGQLGVGSLGAGARIDLSATTPSGARSLRLEGTGDDGREPRATYRVDGIEHTYDADAREWLSRMLERFPALAPGSRSSSVDTHRPDLP